MSRTSAAMQKYLDATTYYLKNLEATGAAPSTVHNYAKRLESFRRFWEEENQRDHSIQGDPGFTDIQAWRDHLIDTGCKPTTVRQYLKELGMFFSAVSDETLGPHRFYEYNPISKRLIPDTRKLERRPYDLILTDEQVMLLWRNNPPAHRRRPEFWPRNYAIVILLLTTELRNAELLSLRLSDLDFQNGELTVESGKGNKFRVVEFPQIAQTAVRLYLSSSIRPSTLSTDDFLFGTQGDPKERTGQAQGFWKRGTAQWLSALVERHVLAVTGVPSVRTHDLRHVGARLDLNNGMSFESLQAKLGHESVTTTQIYSGKLTARRQRKKAALVYQERDRQAQRNADRLAQA